MTSRSSRRSGPVRLAVVGTGMVARLAHINSVRALGERAELVAAADVDEASATDFASTFGAGAAFTSVDAMLDTARPDIVLVCTPPAWHAEVVVAALGAGAWTFCEKPPTASLAELDVIAGAESADGAGRAEFVFQWRSGSAVAHLRRLIDDDVLGKPLVGTASTTWYRDHAYYDVPWRGRWDTEIGGATAGHGIHIIDLLLSLMGPWTTVTGVAGTLDRDMEVEDTSMAVVEFSSGAMASLVTSVLCPREESLVRLDLQGGTLKLHHDYGVAPSGWSLTPRPGLSDDVLAAALPIPDDAPASHVTQLADLVDAFERGDRPATGVDQVRPTMELLAALYKSSSTGRPVKAGEIGPGDPFYDSMHGGRGIASRQT